MVLEYYKTWQEAVKAAIDSTATIWNSYKSTIPENVFATMGDDLYILITDGPNLWRWRQANIISLTGLEKRFSQPDSTTTY